jgi:hypothetical protein
MGDKPREQQFTIKKPDGKYEIYVPQVCLINTKHPNGTPALVTMMEPSASINLAGGEEFIIVLAPKHMVRRT